MPDIFDELAAQQPQAAGGDIFDQLAAQQKSKPSQALPDPDQARQIAEANARMLVEAATRPLPTLPQPPLPQALKSDAQVQAEQPQFIDAKTGIRYRNTPLGQGGFIDAPFTGTQKVVQGVEQMAEPGLREKAGGASQVIRGGIEATAPFVAPAAGLAAPLELGAGLAAGGVTQEAVERGLKALGLSPEYAALAGDLGGLIAGGVAAHGTAKAELRATIKAQLQDKLNADFAARQESERAAREQASQPKQLEAGPQPQQTAKPAEDIHDAEFEDVQPQKALPPAKGDIFDQLAEERKGAGNDQAEQPKPTGTGNSAEPGGRVEAGEEVQPAAVSRGAAEGNGTSQDVAPAPPRTPKVEPAYGRDTSIAVPGEETKYPARYAIREAADVAPSHNPFSFEPNPDYEHRNDRDYSQAGNAARVVENAGKFDPNFVLSDAPTAEHGAPVVDQNGNALGGNNRTMVTKRTYAYNREGADAYRQQLQERAQQFGIDPQQVGRFREPVLVRELTQPIANGSAQRAITDFNKTSAAALSPAERAVTDGKRMSDRTVQDLSARLDDLGEGSTLAQALRGDNGAEVVQGLVKDGVLTDQEKNGLVDERGHLTPEAKDRIGKALVGRMFESPAQMQATPPELRNKLERIAPQVLRVEGRAEWNITPVVREALSVIGEARGRGIQNLDDLSQQRQLVNDKPASYSPQALAVAKVLQRGPVAAARAFRQYANDEALSREGSAGSFFEPPTHQEAFGAAFGEQEPVRALASRTYPAPQLSGSSEPYLSGASHVYHALKMRFEPIPLEGEDAGRARALVMNPSGIEFVGRMGRTKDMGRYAGAVHLGPNQAGAAARNTEAIMARMSSRPQALVRFSQEARAAADAGKSLVLVNGGASERDRSIGLHEELDHALQSATGGGGTLHRHLEQSAVPFLGGNLASQAVRKLGETYPFKSAGEAAAEIGVRLMRPGRYQELGLSLDEGRSLAAHYVRSLRREYGHARPREIARQIFGALRRERRGGEPASLPGSPGPGGGRGPAARTGPALSGGNSGQDSGASPARARSGRVPARDASSGQERVEPDALRQARSDAAGLTSRRFGAKGENTGAPRVLASNPAGAEEPSLFGPDEAEQVAQDSALDRDKLTGERLTAQLKAPLTREEQLKKLKRDKTDKQTDLFGNNEGPEQGALFNRTAKDGERGSAPMVADLAGWLNDKLGPEDGPKANYSGLGAVEDKLVRNLSQLEKVSPKAHTAAIRAASSRAQAATILRAATPAIERALEGSDHTWPELRLALIESRLRGIKERWQDFARQVQQQGDIELHKSFENGLSDLLKNIEGKQGLPQDLAETAASLLQPGANPLTNPGGGPDYKTLREFLAQTFTDAANAVKPAMEAEWFDDVTQHAQVRQALATYKNLVEKPMAENHALNEGVFSGALGPLDTYYPLIPLDRKVNGGPGRRTPYTKPKNSANAFATGLSRGYDATMEGLRDRLMRSVRANDKAALLKTLEDEGLAHTLPPGTQGNNFLRDGVEYRGVRVEIAPGRQVVKDGKSTFIPPRVAVVPEWLANELKPILEADRMNASGIQRVMHAINTVAISGPADLVFHSANLLGSLISNTPFLGESLAGKAGSLAPFAKKFQAIVKVATTDPTTEQSVSDLLDMAKLGLLPEKYASVTYSKKAAETMGAERTRATAAPLLYGPKGLDVRARLVMYRLAKQMNPGATPQQMFHFVNQLGNYTTALQGEIERGLKQYGLSPFYTAGSTMLRNGIHAWTGTGPMPKDGLSLRLAQQLSGGALGMVALWMLAHRAYRGKWPWEDRDSRLMQIPLRPEHRNSQLGRALFGKGPGAGYVNLSFFNPLVARGAHALGIAGAYNAGVLGGKPGQMLEAAQADSVNAISHPFMGPAPRAAFVGLTGNEPYLTSLRDDRGRLAPQFMPAVKHAKPGTESVGRRAAAALKEMNAFYGNVAEASGMGDQAERDRGNKWLRMLVDLAAPGLVAGPSNQAWKARRLRQEAAAERRAR